MGYAHELSYWAYYNIFTLHLLHLLTQCQFPPFRSLPSGWEWSAASWILRWSRWTALVHAEQSPCYPSGASQWSVGCQTRRSRTSSLDQCRGEPVNRQEGIIILHWNGKLCVTQTPEMDIRVCTFKQRHYHYADESQHYKQVKSRWLFQQLCN